MHWLQWALFSFLIWIALNLGYMWWFIVQPLEKVIDRVNKELKKLSADGENSSENIEDRKTEIVKIKYLVRLSGDVCNIFDACKGTRSSLLLFNHDIRRSVKAVQKNWVEFTQLYKINPH